MSGTTVTCHPVISKLGVYSDHFLSRLLSLSDKPKFSCNAHESGRPPVTRSSAEPLIGLGGIRAWRVLT